MYIFFYVHFPLTLSEQSLSIIILFTYILLRKILNLQKQNNIINKPA